MTTIKCNPEHQTTRFVLFCVQIHNFEWCVAIMFTSIQTQSIDTRILATVGRYSGYICQNAYTLIIPAMRFEEENSNNNTMSILIKITVSNLERSRLFPLQLWRKSGEITQTQCIQNDENASVLWLKKWGDGMWPWLFFLPIRTHCLSASNEPNSGEGTQKKRRILIEILMKRYDSLLHMYKIHWCMHEARLSWLHLKYDHKFTTRGKEKQRNGRKKTNTYSKTSVDINPNLITHLNVLRVCVRISATIYRSTTLWTHIAFPK